MEPRISIIVPIYRVEKYLGQCVDSLLAQTLADIEVILVDDGSPDNSGAIAESYAVKDRRVRVIRQCNAGLGPARNAGMALARGEYIAFVDSDDWVRPEMFERLYETAQRNRADIVVGGHCDMAHGRTLIRKVHPLAGQVLCSGMAIEAVRVQLFGHAPEDRETEAFPVSVCMSIYRRTMVEEGQLRFQNILSEDTLFNLVAYGCAKVIAFTDRTDYCYRKERQPSITNSFSEKTWQRFEEFLTQLHRVAEAESEELVLRAEKTAIDYCRLYVGLVADSCLSSAEKKEEIRRFAQQEGVRRCWAKYPVEKLPFKQRSFHQAIQRGWYGVVLALYWARRYQKRRW